MSNQMMYYQIKKLHVSAGSGHHKDLSFDSLRIILYNSRGAMFDEEISTSKPLLEHSTSILGVWVNHVIIHTEIYNLILSKTKTRSLKAPSWEDACSIHYRSKHVFFLSKNITSNQTYTVVWIRKTKQMSLFVFFISLLIVAQHVSGNHVPFIRS